MSENLVEENCRSSEVKRGDWWKLDDLREECAKNRLAWVGYVERIKEDCLPKKPYACIYMHIGRMKEEGDTLGRQRWT